jgi:hypothetical protein
MKPNIFMSYSRRELGFVDDLVSKLEERNYSVWLDYRTLIPGTPWAEQIADGLNNSDTVLLVISKSSIESKYVALEWRHFLETKKRVILLVFEAVDIPKELEIYEWVDFRGNYKKGLNELFFQLEKPIQEKHSVPEKGFKVPDIVWIAFWLSLVTAVYSLRAAWSLFVPWFLLPLPYRIFKRNFNFTQVQAALWILPITLLLTSAAMNDETESSAIFVAAFNSLWFIIPLVLVLRSQGMQRWGKPEATMPKFANPYKPDATIPKPVSFFIDHASQDRLVAEEMTRVFEKYGHKPAADIHSAQAVFALLSIYKTDTNANPESQVVFPVLIQTIKPSQKLSKIQWIDFRRGVRNLEAMARLLPEPAKLLKALGIRPLGNQLILPPIITMARYFIILLGVFTAGAIWQHLWDFSVSTFVAGMSDELANSMLLSYIVNLLLIGALTFFMVRHLDKRQGWFASFRNFSIGMIMMGVLVFFPFVVDVQTTEAITSVDQSTQTSAAIIYPVIMYVLGGAALTAFLFRSYADAHRWFPVKVKKNK